MNKKVNFAEVPIGATRSPRKDFFANNKTNLNNLKQHIKESNSKKDQ